jgi:hypothetical protein
MNPSALFVRMRVRGKKHSKRSAAPWRSKASGAFGSLCQVGTIFICLGSCLSHIGLGRNKVLLFLLMARALPLRAEMTIFLSLTTVAFMSFAPKGVLILSLVTLPTKILSSSPELDVELSELERSSGEQRGNRRKD